jgi:hypothetical protein
MIRRTAAALIAIPALLAAMALPAVAPAAAPAWKLGLTPLPTNFNPGSTGVVSPPVFDPPFYKLVAFNVGGATTTGPITLEASLPAGLEPVEADGSGNSRNPAFVDPDCTIAAQTVTCMSAGPVESGRWLAATIAVEVTAAASTLVAEGSVSGGGTTTVTTTAPTTVSSEVAGFGFMPGPGGVSALFSPPDGLAAAEAGTHPDQLTVDLRFTSKSNQGEVGRLGNAGHPRDIRTDLPPGVVIDPGATPVLCTEVEFQSDTGCPQASQVGLVGVMTVASGSEPRPVFTPLYNMVPPVGEAAELAFNAAGVGIFVHLGGEVRSDGDYGLSGVATDVLARPLNPILSAQAYLWGDPSSSTHDNVRGSCATEASFQTCPVEDQNAPFLTMPSACSGPLEISARANSWEDPDSFVERKTLSTDAAGNPIGVNGCSGLEFEPKLTVQPQTNMAEAPSGVRASLHVPQNPELRDKFGNPQRATATLKDAKITFPDGVALNPAAAAGLDACTSAQIGLLGTGFTPPHRIRFTDEPANCPDGAKIGKVTVKTPLLDHDLPGSLYVAAPYENPFGTLLGAYIVVDDPKSGLVAKLAGKTEADPVTGRLTTTFAENPQLPFEDFTVELFGGTRAALRTPATCGTFTTTSEFSPWSGTPTVTWNDSFQVTKGANGGPCASNEAQMPNAPDFDAGTAIPLAGSFSPFTGRLQRADGTQQLQGLNMSLPPGLTGKLAGIPVCSDAAIAAAETKTGRQELTNPSCPADSQVGEVQVGAGAGSQPYYTSGKIYLTGPYKGGPLSAAVVVPAVAGPFDLGTVVVRAASYVDPRTAEISIKSDPAPRILQGIPLQVRDIRVNLNRPDFTLNPTSCDPMAISGEAISVLNGIVPLSERFQVGGCRGLDFKPKLILRLFGGTGRGAHPRLRAIYDPAPGQANAARVVVALPRSEFLDQAHIRTVCTRVQFAAEKCPQGAIYGRARVTTPLLDEPLEGPVYLRSSSNELPDMVMALKGPPSRPLKAELVGRIDSINGGIRTTIDVVPDVPVTKAVLEMQGGKKGLLINSRNLCKSKNHATVKLDGQNGKAHDFKPPVKNDCGKRRHGSKSSGR